IEQHPAVRSSRQRGTILAVEFESDEATGYFNNLRDKLYHFFLSRGVLLRPLGNLIYMIPPYCITNEQLAEAYEAMEAAFSAFLLQEQD
ncbi:MAG: aminotransferase class III-fold pyridoxal phosphate-dependent enzyme, partial [Phaeodactylibacter sp.]|nr:aminotransferase class III-fold pyridoxal phosphate-dependent enzyme [Phaeodactylibacter sp.]